MRKRLLALLCLLALLLAGCTAKEQPPPEGGYRVYFAVSGQEGAQRTVDYEYYVPAMGDALPRALVERLLAGPQTTGLASPLPASGVALRGITLGEDGVLHLDLSEQYNGLPGVYLTVANACFVLTLNQVEGVRSLYITVEGEPLPYQTIQPLRAEDLLLAGAEDAAVSINTVLYFARSDGSGLAAEYRDVVKTESASLPAAVIAALLDGPQHEELRSAVPEGVTLRSVRVENGLCRVDLSHAFVERISDKAPEARMALYAVVNTLCALDEVSIESVLFTVEGQPLTRYGGVPTLSPLEPNYN